MKGDTAMRRFAFLPFTVLLLLAGTSAAADDLEDGLAAVMSEWAHVKYELPEDDQEAGYEALAARAAALTRRHPDRAEPKVWEAIVRASLAGSMGGLRSLYAALPQATQARELLLEAEAIDPEVLSGSVYTSLGSLYYQVPGSPIGFGDPAKALVYLERATAASPEGIDANFFMGDYWRVQGDADKARHYLERALAAPDRPDRPVADAGRRSEIRAALREISG
jgi:tetratricopeptide (TPR) repeat protein